MLRIKPGDTWQKRDKAIDFMGWLLVAFVVGWISHGVYYHVASLMSDVGTETHGMTQDLR